MIRITAVVAILFAAPSVFAQTPPLADEIEALKRDVATANANSANVKQLLTRVAEIEEKIKQLQAASLATVNEQLDAHEAAISALREQLAEMQGRVADSTTVNGGVMPYNLVLSGFLQSRFDAMWHGTDIENATFRMRRVRLRTRAKVGKFTAAVVGEWEGTPSVLDAWGQYRFSDNYSVRFGQFRVPFLRGFLQPVSRMAFIDRPTGIDRLRYGWDIGAQLRANYAGGDHLIILGLANGAGRNTVNENKLPMGFARIESAIIGKPVTYAETARQADDLRLTVGLSGTVEDKPVPGQVGSIAVNRDISPLGMPDGKIDSAFVASAGLDFIALYSGFEFSGHVIFRHERWGDLFAANPALVTAVGARENRNYWSFHGQVTKALWDNSIVAGVRTSFTRMPFMALGGRTHRVPFADRLLEIDGLVQLFGEEWRMLGVQYTFSRYTNRTTSDPDNNLHHRFIIEAQVSF